MKKFPFLHIILFCVTFLTTLAAGALQIGIDILKQPERIIEGLPFAGTLMCILLFHEFSHYIASKKHHTAATLPYFIPGPTIIGTFGAFIKMKSPIATRKALIDIGASGPIAGFIISIIACLAGLSMSEIVKMPHGEGTLNLGDSLLFSFLSHIVLGGTPDQHDILLHPVAFAGWIGLFVTSLNLIPVGQLDGGHIAFALLGERHRQLSLVLVFALAFMGIFFWEGWILWAVLLIVLGIRHPPVIYWEVPLDSRRRLVGLLSLVIFVITFIPSPFRLVL
jgi:membrane-associated protease RseP (regulator of RpoE activity)